MSLVRPWLFVFLLVLTYSQEVIARNSGFFHSCLTEYLQQEPPDTTIKKKPSAKLVDSNQVASIDTFNFKVSKDSLTAPVAYHADDSMVLHVPEKKMYLYGKKSTVKYTDMDLSAPVITYDQNTNLVRAHLQKDSNGNVISFPTFIQRDSKMVSDTIVFNMQTGKGLTKGTYTQQGEMYVYGQKIKRADEDVFYALNGRFTTCNLDTPHFAFISRQIKFINQKMAFSGPVHPEFEGVPVPVVLPFGIYPLSKGRHSGILSPSFTANQQYGIGLENFGYYKVFNDNWDLETRGTLFSYGGWMASARPRYLKRYRYQGNFDLSYINTKILDEPANRSFNIRWSHRIDNRARPGVSFSANVNAGSSSYNQNVPNRPVQNFQNLMNSTISYSKTWKDKPYNIAITANHDQNTLSKLINLNMPGINFNLNTIYPFRRQEPIGEYKWYENIGVGLNTSANGRTFFYDDSTGIFTQARENFIWGASHSVPVTLSLPSLGPVQVSPSFSYRENWYQKKILRQYNPLKKRVDTLSVKEGFYTERDIAFGASATTRIFGMFTFKKGSRVKAIRHEIRPQVGFNYKPNINKSHFQLLQADSFGRTARFSIYDGNFVPPFGYGKSGSLTFGIDNNISMKIRNRKDTSEDAVKKVVLIDGLNLTGNYNLLADSFKMSILNLSARTNLFEKVQITGSAQFDPYQLNAAGRRIDKLIWAKNPLSLGRMMSATVSLQSSFRGGEKSGKDKNAQQPEAGLMNPDGTPVTDYEAEAAYIRSNPSEFVDFNIPWDVSFGYSFRYSKTPLGGGGFVKSVNQDVNINSSMNLTPKWKLGATGSYNITAKEIGVVSMYLSRDMHCWQMSINVSPVGRWRYFSINIAPKSPILRDLKVNRTRSFVDL